MDLLFGNSSIQNPLNIKRLVIDVIDILFDNIYFSQVKSSQSKYDLEIKI